MYKNSFKFLTLLFIVFVACNKDDEIVSDFPSSPDDGNAPLISMVNPPDGFYLLPGQQQTFNPEVGGSEDISYLWSVDGSSAANTSSFSFSSEITGEYTIKLKVSNVYGEASEDIKVTVTEQLPIKVVFPTPLYTSESNVRYTEPGRPIYLRPYVEPLEGLIFKWSVNGAVLQESADLLFSFTPATVGDYNVTFTAFYADEMEGGNENASFRGSVSMEIPVVCMKPVSSGVSSSEFKVIEFVPAPGQYVNDASSGYKDVTTMKQACEYAQSRFDSRNYVSLGGWGGSIVVSAPEPIINTGGYDFSIYANSFDTSNEPGIVWVMQDLNGNGIPDEEWYQLKGSFYGNKAFTQFYAVTYYKAPPKMDTPWMDIFGKEGFVKWMGSYHSQDYYYPLWINTDSYTLYGSRLPSQAVQDPVTGVWGNNPFDWGYADNSGSDRSYGSGNGETDFRNFFKISDAVNPDGTPANLKSINFIKVQTAVNGSAGWLGENSTEICGFAIGGK